MDSGKDMVAAAVAVGGGDYDLGLFRFNANGHADDTFGTNGLVTQDFESRELVSDLQRSGSKLLIPMTRTRTGQPTQMAVARLHADGSPDTGFDLGLAVAELPNAGGGALGIQGDGRIVAAGNSRPSPPGAVYRFAVVRFLAA